MPGRVELVAWPTSWNFAGRAIQREDQCLVNHYGFICSVELEVGASCPPWNTLILTLSRSLLESEVLELFIVGALSAVCRDVSVFSVRCRHRQEARGTIRSREQKTD